MGAKRKVGSNQFAETWVSTTDDGRAAERSQALAGGVSAEHAADVDGRLAEMWGEDQQLAGRVASLTGSLHQVAGHRRDRDGRWSGSFEEALAAEVPPWEVTRRERWVAELGEVQQRRSDLRDDCAPLEAEFAEHRWSRFFLVQNTGGHIHSSMGCQTCFADTQFGWLPELSGQDERSAVEAHGEILCSVCFPSAPSAWTSGVSRVVAAAREERSAAKAARAAKKLEKALMPDGSDLVVVVDQGGRRPFRERFSTLASAKMWVTNAMEWGEDHPSFPPEAVRQVAEAIAVKTGESVDQVMAAARVRAAKRR